MNSLYRPPASQQIYKATVPPEYHKFSVEQYFSSRFPYQSREAWIAQILNGDIRVNGEKAQPDWVLRKGDDIITHAGVRQEPPADRSLNVVYQDRHIRVFNKPAPIPVHPSGRYFQNSMTEILKTTFPDEVPRPVQRLDVTTTGLIVFARTRQAAGFLMKEFKKHRIQKEYLALVKGKPDKKQFTLTAPIGVVNGAQRGVGEGIKKPKSATTQVEWLASANAHSVLKVIPLSGRTNQIRVHLSNHNLPIFNDDVYGEGEPGSYEYGLHAWKLSFQCLDRHLEFKVPPPPHFQPYLRGLDKNTL
ncbi:MAG: RluA family pseudouridine synthase [Nitrospina sp.]|jgi:RluA family pseudouridine synthase|nr:RluA family pseudouridine synthase [Nitrospina sp.]